MSYDLNNYLATAEHKEEEEEEKKKRGRVIARQGQEGNPHP
jgi:hypothetical protein